MPVVIGSVLSLLMSMTAGAALYMIGSSLAGATGGFIGGLLGGSIIVMTVWTIIITVISRYVYAKYMVSKVGKYYRDYKQ